MIKQEKLSYSVLMHMLISLSYLTKDRFSIINDECKITDNITEFVEYFKNAPLLDNEPSSELSKKKILALCDFIFTIKKDDGSKNNDEQYESRLKEFRNDKGDIKFECFQDEIS